MRQAGSLLLLFFFSLSAATEPLIQKIEVKKNSIKVTPGQKFAAVALQRRSHFISYDEPKLDLRLYDPSITIMPFFFDAIASVLRSDLELSVEALDRDLFKSIEKIRATLKRFHPKVSWNGKLVPKKLIKHRFDFPQNRLLLPFSGGIDSIYSLLTNLDKEITFVTVRGQIDSTIPNQLHPIRDLLHSRPPFNAFPSTECFTQGMYLPNHRAPQHITKEIYNWYNQCIGDFHWMGTALPLMIFYKTPNLLISSSGAALYPHPRASNPQFKEDFAFGDLRIVAPDALTPRIEKTALIADHSERLPIKVCMKNKKGTNCSRCLKCLRTINDLYILGYNPNEFGFHTTEELAKRDFEKELQILLGKNAKKYQIETHFFVDILRYIEEHNLAKPDSYASWYYNLLIDHPLVIQYHQNLEKYHQTHR